MRRILAYSGEVPGTSDILSTNKNVLMALGLLAQDLLGSATCVSGLPCSPAGGLTVQIGLGRIYSPVAVDATAYSDLGTDTADIIMKQGILLAAVTLNCPVPVTSGQSINYLVEAQYQDSDTAVEVLPYYNLLNPLSPLSGPGGLGASQATQRDGIISLIAKAGTPAATGTQTTPAPDSGYVGLYVITVAFGATTITSGNIAQASGAPFLSFSALTALTQAAADLRYLQLTAQTAAESSASVTPTSLIYPEGDIRRYGAIVSASDNSAAITNALKVSGAGGNAAFIPGGNWKITSALVAPAGSSMHGVGKASKITPANGVDGLQFTASDAGLVPQSRFFRDFQIVGTLAGTTNSAHGIYINTTQVVHTQFSNLSILNFQYGAYIQGLYDSSFQNCFIQTCWNGIYFNNQSVNVWLLNNTIQLVGSLITASGASNGISAQGAPEVEGLHIQGGSIYGFNYNINFGLVFEVQIEAVDISFATKCPVLFTSTLGGLVIRDCWIELGSAATSGTWNDGGTGTGNLTGIFIGAITPSVNAKVHIENNYIVSDGTLPGSGSTGIYIGNSNNGISVHDNHILNWDIGIGGGNTLNNVGSSGIGYTIQGNTINATTSSWLLVSSCTELTLGPNYIVSGGPGAFNTTAPVSMVYKQPNAPMRGTIAFASSTSAAVTLTNPLPIGLTNYSVSLGGNSAGFCYSTSKTNTGFVINCPVSNSNSVDWAIS